MKLQIAVFGIATLSSMLLMSMQPLTVANLEPRQYVAPAEQESEWVIVDSEEKGNQCGAGEESPSKDHWFLLIQDEIAIESIRRNHIIKEEESFFIRAKERFWSDLKKQGESAIKILDCLERRKVLDLESLQRSNVVSDEHVKIKGLEKVFRQEIALILHKERFKKCGLKVN